MNIEQIKPDLMVHAKGMGAMGGSGGIHVGTVDHLEGDWGAAKGATHPRLSWATARRHEHVCLCLRPKTSVAAKQIKLLAQTAVPSLF